MTDRAAHPARPTVRRATLDDIAALRRLRWEMTDEMSEATEDAAAFRLRFDAFATRALAGGHWAIFVAERDFTLLGMVWVQLVDRGPRPNATPATYAYITSVFVEAAERNAGLGRRILDAALAWIGAQDAEMTVLWPSERSGPFYERAGFAPSDAIVRRR